MGTSDDGELEVVDEVGYSSSEEMGNVARSQPESRDRNTGQRKETESAERAWPVAREVVNAQTVVAFDSHFHLDRCQHQLDKADLSVPELCQLHLGSTPKVPVHVDGGIIVFCDHTGFPQVYPKVKGFGSAVGIHPSHALADTESAVYLVQNELRKEGVVALGEIGLDYTRPRSQWQTQEAMFKALLELACPIRPVVLHFRESRDGGYESEVYFKGLQIMKEWVSPRQRMQLHCFTGGVDQALAWMTTFPRCYFSISGLVLTFDRFQQAAVKRIPEDRLLIETDSPYLRTDRRASLNTPAFVGDVARAVAEIRGVTTEEILAVTRRNGRRLFEVVL